MSAIARARSRASMRGVSGTADIENVGEVEPELRVNVDRNALSVLAFPFPDRGDDERVGGESGEHP